MERPLLLACAIALAAAGCGGSAEPGSAPSPEPEVPAGYPVDVASGTLADGGAWRLEVTGLGEVCLHTPEEHGCTEHDPWVVGTLAREDGALVYVGLPSCVSRLEIRGGAGVVGDAETSTDDDVAYGVVEVPTGLVDDLTLAGVGSNGAELLALDRLEDDPTTRVPPIGC